MRTRLKKQDRKNSILAAACKVAEKTGYRNITRQEVAAQADCSPGLVSFYYASMPHLRSEVLRQAADTENGVLLLQGLLNKDPVLEEVTLPRRERLVKIMCENILWG